MLASINTPHPNRTVLLQHKANQFSLIKHQMNPVWATKQLQTLAPQTHNGLCSVKKKKKIFITLRLHNSIYSIRNSLTNDIIMFMNL